MHVVDASQWDEPISVRYGCQHCGYETPWIEARTATEAKKGVPCPRCNETDTPVREDETSERVEH
jgi:DNA-directed RNA polymerase subunit RPC12/RpoP